jgi:hypothetical protein
LYGLGNLLPALAPPPEEREVISMDFIGKPNKQYHSHRGVNVFEEGTVP